jgi:bifunctional N-acetylglucosamine-1-phosphate-uridyltransferase/glucosamine-1-phosphate-acetyltransferase GlmU-like protein
MENSDILKEISRIKSHFTGADPDKLEVLNGMIEQAAYETVFLKQLNEQALESGLVKYHPENTQLQRTLPISGEIAKHTAALTNILDKLARHLIVAGDDDGDELADYE